MLGERRAARETCAGGGQHRTSPLLEKEVRCLIYIENLQWIDCTRHLSVKKRCVDFAMQAEHSLELQTSYLKHIMRRGACFHNLIASLSNFVLFLNG